MRNQILLCVRSLIVGAFICASVIIMAHAQNVPPPPAQSSDRFGVYHWNPDYSGFPGTLNQQFAALNNLIASTKTRTLRIALGSGNMAVKKAATQSSTAFDGSADRGVDGPYDGDYFRSNTVTHTSVETAPWWQVDLGSVQTIGSIRVWNRTDCCGERLSNFYVFVSDAPFTSGDLTTTLIQPGVSNWRFPGKAGTAETFPINRTGRYVRVQLGDPGVLSLAEVQIFESMIKVADSEPFKSVFSDPRFDTIFVTTFGPQNFDWGGYVKLNPSCVPDCNPIHLPPPNYSAEYQHVNALASYLTGIDPNTETYRFPRKNFIILNWESDSDLGYWVENLAFPVGQKFLADRDDPRIDPYWDEFIELHQTRSNAVRDARNIQPGSPGDPNRPKLYSGFEIAMTYRLDRQIGANYGRCGSAGRPTWCAIDHVAPRLTVDYYSYSAWDSTRSRKATNFNAYLPFELKKDLEFALNKVNDRLDGNTYTMTNFVLGEYGMNNFPLADNFGAQYIKEVNSAVDALGLSYAIWWQAKDNHERLWVDDATPPSATRGGEGGDSWHDITANPTPIYGQKAFQTENRSGQHGIYFENTNPNVDPILYLPGSELNTYVYVYLDPVSPPQAIMLEWQDNAGSKDHRAFWGADLINKGTFGTPSRRPMGALPATGQWVRLEVKAGDVDLGTNADKQVIKGFGVYLYNGKATWDYHGVNDKYGLFTTDQDNVVRGTARKEAFSSSNTADVVWVDENSDIPVGNRLVFSEGGATESWEVLNRTDIPHPAPMPVSGQYAFKTQNSLGTNPHVGHKIYFENAATTMTVNPGDVLFAYVYLDPANPPEELLLEWRASTGIGDLWDHRAYWGVNHFNWGSDGGGPSRRRIGVSMPPLGRWARLEIPASIVGLEGKTVTGFGFALFKGRGAFDRLGKRSNDIVWADEVAHIPTSARFADSWGMGSESWEVLDGNAFPQPNPLPVSGRYAFRTQNSLGANPPGLHQIWFSNPANPLTIKGGDSLFAYVYLDPLNPPQELMLQWCGGSCEHRAYWGPGLTGSVFGWGADGESSRRPISYSLPPLGQWVRLEAPASLVGLEGQTITGFALTLYGGRGAFDRIGKTTKDVVWLDEDADIPIANRFQDSGDSWNASTIATPISGNQAFQTISAAGMHQLYTFGLPNTLAVNAGDALFVYVYLNPASPPTELMLQWNNGSWEHRVYWGDNRINYGTADTASRRYMGPMPPVGQWVRLEVPISRLGIASGSTLNGFAFTLFGGQGVFDRVGKIANTYLDY